ncbi:hypothetical protein [Reinekea marinisedimentorum]|uniref:Uncharacterized protein n=1 Tax=Reinekea marinisedimentorum TaxID=230495 RepID=A0A4R3I7S0_9GAMM|nr:hypothetical protein [Reinekea marinisedimentorum]TCS42087.1 hypothetical protein BCF53_104192 [Reinekea marinisedimentorum]
MAAIILGKNLLSKEELIEFAFSELNHRGLNLAQLTDLTTDAAVQSSLSLIRMMKAERIYVSTKPAITNTPAPNR